MHGWNVLGDERSQGDLFSNKMMVHFNLFYSSMKYEIDGHVESAHVVAIELWSVRKRNANVPEDEANPCVILQLHLP